MAAKKNYHKPAEDPRTIGGGLKAAGRERREKLQMIINTKPRHTRNDLLPSMELQTIAIADIKVPKHMVRKLDPGHIKEVANGIQEHSHPFEGVIDHSADIRWTDHSARSR
jgi:hypothetical protein